MNSVSIADEVNKLLSGFKFFGEARQTKYGVWVYLNEPNFDEIDVHRILIPDMSQTLFMQGIYAEPRPSDPLIRTPEVTHKEYGTPWIKVIGLIQGIPEQTLRERINDVIPYAAKQFEGMLVTEPKERKAARKNYANAAQRMRDGITFQIYEQELVAHVHPECFSK